MSAQFTIEKQSFSVTTLAGADAEERAYWASVTPSERLRALETNRQIIYGYNPTTARFQRILEITPFPPG
ncbi:MAG: hypothetical protein HYV02_07215 [Deltaproteobacteria bacterium]|nr:hypothetical protein [Deltaproteobacteria bacterium]